MYHMVPDALDKMLSPPPQIELLSDRWNKQN